jgi:hypothetical protein
VVSVKQAKKDDDEPTLKLTGEFVERKEKEKPEAVGAHSDDT